MPTLLAIGAQLLMKLIGYEFISRVLILGAQEYSKTTETHLDDQVTDAVAKAWGVSPAVLK